MSTRPPVRVAVVIPKYGLVGGGEKFAAELTARIAQQSSFEIHVLANQWHENSPLIRFHKIPIITFPRTLTTISFAWFAQRCIEKLGFDIIHAHERIFAADLVSLHSIPHRLWMREVRRKRFLSLFDHATIWVERRMVGSKLKTLFLPVSSIAQERFVAEYPYLSDRVEILHPGVDPARFRRLSRSQCRKQVCREFGFAENDLILLFVGMNFELKGLAQVMSALARARSSRRGARLKLLVVGKGNERRYRKLAEVKGVGKAVQFAGVRTGNIEELYLASDLFAMLSSFDTFGMTVLEAMAASLPVIISPRVGAADLVQDGHNGFIVDRDDLDGISERILLLLDEGRREEMGRRAHETTQRHTWDLMAENVMGLYETILSRRRGPETGEP